MNKICEYCGIEKKSNCFWKLYKTNNLRKFCKACLFKIQKRLFLQNRSICSRCEQEKDLSNFHKSKNQSRGIVSFCKDCNIKRDIERKPKKKLNSREYYLNHKSKIKDKYNNIRNTVIDYYGRFCVCCGDNRSEFLTIEHKNRSGKEHRIKYKNQTAVYKDIIKQGFPKDKFEILCYNCNLSKGVRREDLCYHQKHFIEEILSNENLY